jgi:hypothetical protein
MHPFVHGDEAVTGAFRRDGRRPVCDYGFDAAQRLALDDWRAWVADQGEAAARLELARAAQPATGPGPIVAIIPRLRQAIGAALVAAGRRVQGATAPGANPDVGGGTAR